MNLQELLKNIEVLEIIGAQNPVVNEIHFDSRKVKSADLFVAVKGTQSDGHDYIDKVIVQGAKVVVCEELPKQLNDGVSYVKVSNSAKAIGVLASNYYDNPSAQLQLIGITGTNGKTTTVTLLHQLFVALGYKVGLLSTIRNLIHTHEVAATHTTPDPIQMNKLLADMVAEGCDYCFMEVSSHAIHQHRIAGLTFKGGVFSNITQDHLDYHKTFAEYIQAKKMFFDALPKNAFALVNADDKNGAIMVQNTKAKKLSYGLKSMATYRGRILEAHIDGMLVSFEGTEIWTRFIGGFNAYNLLVVFAVAKLLDQNHDEVAMALSNLKSVDGRFEYIKSKEGKIAIVDYAHTPDALDNVLKTIIELAEGNQRIITVVGAGGNRDKTKRPLMANIAAKGSQQVVLTSDNPRNEDPDDIINDMREGVLAPLSSKLLCISNRKEAIKTACALAQPGDFILVAGKGHENYQEVKGVKHHFDDKEVLNEIFEIN